MHLKCRLCNNFKDILFYFARLSDRHPYIRTKIPSQKIIKFLRLCLTSDFLLDIMTKSQTAKLFNCFCGISLYYKTCIHVPRKIYYLYCHLITETEERTDIIPSVFIFERKAKVQDLCLNTSAFSHIVFNRFFPIKIGKFIHIFF